MFYIISVLQPIFILITKLKNKQVETELFVDVYLNLPQDFAFDIDEIIIRINKQNKKIDVLPNVIPKNIAQKMIKCYKGNFREFIELLESNIELFLCGKDIEPDKRAENIEPAEKVRTNSDKEDVEHVKIENIDDSATIYREAKVIPPAKSDAQTNHTAKVTNISEDMQGLSMKANKIKQIDDFRFPVNQVKHTNLEYKHERENITLLAAVQINLSIECIRCKKRKSVKIEQYAHNFTCENCISKYTIEYVPTTSMKYLGKLTVKNCRFITFNPFRLQIACGFCTQSYFETHEIYKNTKFSMNCYKCNNKLYFYLQDVIFKSEKKKELAITDKGTCKHYKKSQRLFRFPCCNVVYPCDICHDEDNDHKAELANRMICGLCKKEQSVKKECECGKNLVGSKSKHWEGGKGMRDKGKMSKKDNKKYKK